MEGTTDAYQPSDKCYLCADKTPHGKAEHDRKVAEMEAFADGLGLRTAMPEGWYSVTA